MQNRNNTPISAATLAEALQKLQDVRDLLMPFLFALSAKERKRLSKMGDKSLAFMLKTAELAAANPGLLPGYVKVDDLKLDAATVQQLLPVLQALASLTADVTTTRMLAGSEGYVTALLVYGAFQAAAANGQLAAQTAVDQLEPRFEGQARGGKAGKGKKKGGDTPDAPGQPPVNP